MNTVDIAKKLLDLSAALPPGEWRALRDPKDGVENAGDTGIVLRYEHPQEGLGLLGPYRPAWSTCEFVAFARNHVEDLAHVVVDGEVLLKQMLEDTKKARLEVQTLIAESLTERDAVITALRARLDAAEEVIEAGRAAASAPDNSDALYDAFEEALATYDASKDPKP